MTLYLILMTLQHQSRSHNENNLNNKFPIVANVTNTHLLHQPVSLSREDVQWVMPSAPVEINQEQNGGRFNFMHTLLVVRGTDITIQEFNPLIHLHAH